MRTRGFVRRLREGLVPRGKRLGDFPRRLNLGCGLDYRPGWINVDRYAPRADKRFDLFRVPYPIPAGSIDYALAEQVLEHVPPRIGDEDGLLVVIAELHRILRPGGLLYVGLPYAGSDNDYNNVTHYRHFIRSSFDFLDPERTRNPPLTAQSPVRFRVHRTDVQRSVKLTRWFDSAYHLSKYLGFDPNVGRKRGLHFLLEKIGEGVRKR